VDDPHTTQGPYAQGPYAQGPYAQGVIEHILSLVYLAYMDLPWDVAHLAVNLAHVVSPEPAVLLAMKFIGCRTNEPPLDFIARMWCTDVETLVHAELDALRQINWSIGPFLPPAT
jgi:hypothetical protein